MKLRDYLIGMTTQYINKGRIMKNTLHAIKRRLQNIEFRLKDVQEPIDVILTAWHDLLIAMTSHNEKIRKDDGSRVEFLDGSITNLDNASWNFLKKQLTPNKSRQQGGGAVANLSRRTKNVAEGGARNNFLLSIASSVTPEIDKIVKKLNDKGQKGKEKEGENWKKATQQCKKIEDIFSANDLQPPEGKRRSKYYKQKQRALLGEFLQPVLLPGFFSRIPQGSNPPDSPPSRTPLAHTRTLWQTPEYREAMKRYRAAAREQDRGTTKNHPSSPAAASGRSLKQKKPSIS